MENAHRVSFLLSQIFISQCVVSCSRRIPLHNLIIFNQANNLINTESPPVSRSVQFNIQLQLREIHIKSETVQNCIRNETVVRMKYAISLSDKFVRLGQREQRLRVRLSSLRSLNSLVAAQQPGRDRGLSDAQRADCGNDVLRAKRLF